MAVLNLKGLFCIGGLSSNDLMVAQTVTRKEETAFPSHHQYHPPHRSTLRCFLSRVAVAIHLS